MKVVWASSSGQAQDGRETCVFFLFAFSLSIVLSERAKVNEAQEHRNDTDRSRRHSDQMSEQQAKNQRKMDRKSAKILAKSIKNRRKIDQKSINIDQKSIKIRSGRAPPQSRCWTLSRSIFDRFLAPTWAQLGAKLGPSRTQKRHKTHAQVT